MLRKVRFITHITLLHSLTIGAIGYTMLPSQVFSTQAHADAPRHRQAPKQPTKHRFVLVSGVPIRIVIADHGINLPVDKGTYDPASGTWTLSPTRAEYATITPLVNNVSGNTLIYGHGTDAVFAKLGTPPPTKDTIALVFTDNGHLLQYRFESEKNVVPTDTSIFDERPESPVLTVQTCTGVFSEWRTMYRFTFEKVVQ